MKIHQKNCAKFSDLIVFILYMVKFSTSKTQVLNQKHQIILIIQHISTKVAKVLQLLLLLLLFNAIK